MYSVLGLMPSISIPGKPSIVYVLPEPVWPYANTQTLYPSKADSTNRANSSKIFSWLAVGGKTLSKENSCLVPLGLPLQLTESDPSNFPTSIVHSSTKLILHILDK